MGLYLKASLQGGQRNVYLSARDKAGAESGWQLRGTWPPGNFPPVTAVARPNSSAGATGSFYFEFQDGNGYTDIKSAKVVLNASRTDAQSCSLEYNPTAGTLRLWNDGGTGWLGPYPLAEAEKLGNSQCRVMSANAHTSGNSVYFYPIITFLPSFAGPKNIYSYVEDAAGTSSGWELKGAFTATNPAPSASALPDTGSGASAHITFSLNDGSGYDDIVVARFLVGATESLANSCAFDFDPVSERLRISLDSGAGWSDFVSISDAPNLSNSQCSVSSFWHWKWGDTLSVGVDMRFRGSYAGPKKLFLLGTDKSGQSSGWVEKGSWTVVNAASAVKLEPASGTGSSLPFQLTFSDENGYEDLESVALLINTSATAAGGCALQFDAVRQKVKAAYDSGAWTEEADPYSSYRFENSQCAIQISGAYSLGNDVFLSGTFSFKNGFAGTKNLYVRGKERSAAGDGAWVSKGSWLVQPNVAPQLQGMTPESGSGYNATFRLTVTDGNGASDLQNINAGFWHQATARHVCSFVIYPASRNISIVPENYGSGDWGTIGSAKTLSTSTCSIDLSKTNLVAHASGTGVIVDLPVTFKPGSEGLAYSRVQAWDGAGASTSETLAAWNIGTGPKGLLLAFESAPPDRYIYLDNRYHATPAKVAVVSGSAVSVDAATPQFEGPDKRWAFQAWSDNGAAKHTITAPDVPTTYRVTYAPQYRLAVWASPGSAGSVAATPGSDYYYNPGTQVQVSATAYSGFAFIGWTGDVSGTALTATVVMDGPRTATANFRSLTGVTIATVPAGLQIVADGNTYTSPAILNWAAGSKHTIEAKTPQIGTAGVRYVFDRWGDGGAAQHEVTAAAGGLSTAYFKTQYLLRTSVSPAASGTIAVTPALADSYFDSGTSVQLHASPDRNAGYGFKQWTGDLSVKTNPASLTMNGPKTVAAQFEPVPGVTLSTNPPGLSIIVDGTTYTAPRTFNWDSGTQHTISTGSPQNPAGARNVFASWSDGGAQTHSITVPPGGATYTANFTAQYLLTLKVAPPGAGTLTASPASSDGYYAAGTAVSLTAAATGGFRLGYYSGDASGPVSIVSVAMSGPRMVTANFVTGATNQPPLPADVSPAYGLGATQAFSAAYSDPNGWVDIARATLSLHEGPTRTDAACYAEFDARQSTFRLRDDAGTGWTGPSALGSGADVQNGACILNPRASSFSGSGETLTVNFALTFKSSFTAGRSPKKQICQTVFDQAGAGGYPLCMGVWNPTTAAGTLVDRYRLYHTALQRHLYTTDLNEYSYLGSVGWKQEGVQGRIYDQGVTVSAVAATPFYRMYYTPQQRHFWTADRGEYMYWVHVSQGTWVGEGVDSFILPAQTPGSVPLYRILRLHVNSPVHLWTTDFGEMDYWVNTAKMWKSEGIAGYLYPAATAGAKAHPAAVQAAALLHVVSAATLESGPVAPGQLVRLYAQSLTRFARVALNGQYVEVLDAGENWVEAVVPEWLRAGETVAVELEDFGIRARVELPVVATRPGVFANGPFGRGEALTLPSEAATIIVTGVHSEVRVSIAERPAEVLEVRALGGGRTAVTFRKPEEVERGAVMLWSGDAPSQPGVVLP